MDEPKSNNCTVIFKCTHMNSCVYRIGQKCKYIFGNDCTSLVAQANAMTIYLKELMK